MKTRQRRVPVEIPCTVDVAWMIGLFVAEGHTGAGTATWTLGVHEQALQERLVATLHQLNYQPSVRTRDSVMTITVCHGAFAEWMEELCGRGAMNKHFPDTLLFHQDQEMVWSMLYGYAQGDGWLDAKLGRWQGKTISVRLALQFQLVCGRLGVLVSLHQNRPFASCIQGRIRNNDIL